MNENRITKLLRELRQRVPQEPDWTPSVAEQEFGFAREITACLPPSWEPPSGDVYSARQVIWNAIKEYLETPMPEHILLIKAMPGIGKTTAAVRAIEELTAGRIAYSGPRHDFFDDVLAKSCNPAQWYEWLPRQAGDEDKTETCRYTPQINKWMQRGYQGIDFCRGVCGWDYVNKVCPYHAQKKRTERIIFIQHQHVSLGHPMDFSVLVGDENPVSAFMNPWTIPAEYIFPPEMDYSESLSEIMHDLQTLASVLEKPMQGPELLATIGGAEAVFAACESFELPADALAYGGISHPDQADKVPYFHLPRLIELLTRESYAAMGGTPYPERIIASKAGLTLLLKHETSEMAQHVIWLDATAQEAVYRSLFRRPVKIVNATARLQGKIYQVVDRANGKGGLINGEGELQKNAKQAKQIIDSIIADREYQSPSLITFKGVSEQIEDIDGGHFYAARGTNRHEDADAMFVLGAPMAPIKRVVDMAKMIFFRRDGGFRVEWSSKPTPYNFIADDGKGRQYPISSFWGDNDLRAVLQMVREEEILQAAHRGRPVNHPVDIWLLTNIPIDALPPDALLTMRDILQAPLGVDIWRWGEVREIMNRQNTVTRLDIEGLGYSDRTARRYIKIIAGMDGWELAAVKTGKRGMPPKVAVKGKKTNE